MIFLIFMSIAIDMAYAGLQGLGSSAEGSSAVGRLESRAEICYHDSFGMNYRCNPGFVCCNGLILSSCVPTGSLCCDNGDSIGWCPIDASCGRDSFGIPICTEPDGETITATIASTETAVETITETETQSATLESTTAYTTTSSTTFSTFSVTTPTTSQSVASQTAPAPTTSPTVTHEKGLSKGVIIAISVSIGCTVVSIICGFLGRWFLHRRAEKKKESY